MFILFDNGTPAPLRYALKGHTVVEAIERGWDKLVNDELLAVAEAAGFEVLLSFFRDYGSSFCARSVSARAHFMGGHRHERAGTRRSRDRFPCIDCSVLYCSRVSARYPASGLRGRDACGSPGILRSV